MYDIIGDIHGEVETLKHMLLSLGYVEGEEGYFHPKRKAVFVGDFVDRGPKIFETLELVQKMVIAGNAYAVVGNHELNVLSFYTKDSDGLYLKQHNLKNRTQIKKTYEEFKLDKPRRKAIVKWLRTLPLFLELDGFRVVHACWDQQAVDLLKKKNPKNCLNKKFLRKLNLETGDVFDAAMLILKGRDFSMPSDLILKDDYGFKRTSFRIKWWEPMNGKSFREISFGNKFLLPNYTLPPQLSFDIPIYPEDEKAVFFGHYCLGNAAGPVRNNLCCVDACLANGGSLAVYCWDGLPLDAKKMIWVKKIKKALVKS
ncbi:metallophosphoesterase [Labilibaculum sp.]|uniref:metallophosphoesterase n=1 Tax=Labilibaculum sp. TaxID=2060723 RepID=UPI00356B0212